MSTVQWIPYRIDYDPKDDREETGIARLRTWKASWWRREQAVWKAGKLPGGLKVGLFIYCGPNDEHRATAVIPELMRTALESLGVKVLYLHPEASVSACGEGHWRNGILLGQQMEVAVIGRCYTFGDYHDLDLRPHLPNGYAMRKGFVMGVKFKEPTGFQSAYRTLAEQGVLEILEVLKAVTTMTELPSPRFRSELAESWYEPWGPPTVEHLASEGRLSFSKVRD